ncbi:hypothetical protein H6768_03830 [Candidatus Peribacteria bacterium]|nr:hypothetical protein [Candidatus Peribacteria bacterium]
MVYPEPGLVIVARVPATLETATAVVPVALNETPVTLPSAIVAVAETEAGVQPPPEMVRVGAVRYPDHEFVIERVTVVPDNTASITAFTGAVVPVGGGMTNVGGVVQLDIPVGSAISISVPAVQVPQVIVTVSTVCVVALIVAAREPVHPDAGIAVTVGAVTYPDQPALSVIVPEVLTVAVALFHFASRWTLVIFPVARSAVAFALG